MADKKSGKWHKVGAVIAKKNGKGNCLILGSNKNKNAQYNFDVLLSIKDSSGNVTVKKVNPVLTITDPRNRRGITEEERNRLPESLISELFFVENEE